MGSAVEAQGRRRVRREAWPPELAPTIARGRERGHRSMQSPERVQGLVTRERGAARPTRWRRCCACNMRMGRYREEMDG